MATARTPRRARGYHRGDLDRELVDVGVALVRAHGHPAVSIRAVARGAKVSHTAAHYHFATREALLAAIAIRGFEQMTAALADSVRAAPRARRMRALGVAYVEHAVREPELYRLMFGAELADRDAHLGLATAATALLAQLSDQLGSEPVLTDAAAAAWAVVHGLASLLVEGQLARLAASHRTTARLIEAVLAQVAFEPPR